MQQRSLFSFFSKKRGENARNIQKLADGKSSSPSPSGGVLDEPSGVDHSQSSTEPPSPLEFVQDITTTPVMKAGGEPNRRTMEIDEFRVSANVYVYRSTI